MTARRSRPARKGSPAASRATPAKSASGGPASAVTLGSSVGRRLVAASVLGSGAVFLEGTVVNVALPALARDFELGVEGLHWVLNSYLITLSALTLLGGALGDRYGRRLVFTAGAVAFALTSAACALTPGMTSLLLVRAAQGAAGAMLVPNSLALLETEFDGEDRATAIGRWAGWSGISPAAGPLVGGWMVDAASWRWVFAIIVPIALAAAWLTWGSRPAAARHLTSSASASGATRRVDYLGAVLATFALAATSAALIAGPRTGFGSIPIVAGLVTGGALIVAFVLVERRVASPLVPPSLFRVPEFTGANLTTLLVYAALSGLLLLLVLQLQNNLGYSALQAGAALLPMNVLLLILSPAAGRLARRTGARLPMVGGALVAAAGMALLTRVEPGVRYLTVILPAVVVFGIGLAMFVAPLTSVVLAAAPDEDAGIASGVNNAVARLAGLLAAAVLPIAAGIGGLARLGGPGLTTGFVRATWICASLCAAGAVTTFLTISRSPARD